MAKTPETVSPTDVEAALVEWGEKRKKDPQLLYHQQNVQKKLEDLSRLLEANQGAICGKIVAALGVNYFLTRLQLYEVLPELRESLQKTYRNRQVIDFLRGWFHKVSGGRIRVEGDPDYAGYYLDLSAESEYDTGEAEFEHFPINEQDLPAGKGIAH